jgi:hypothetical protein
MQLGKQPDHRDHCVGRPMTGVAAGTLAVTAMHDCRQDGKCKGALLPK